MSLRRTNARALAHAFLSGPWTLRVLLARGDFAVDAGGPWLRGLVEDVLSTFPEAPLHRVEDVEAFIDANRHFDAAWRQRQLPHATPRFLPFEPTMGPRRWDVPALATLRELADWLGVSDEELDWFADRRGLNGLTQASQLQHYRCVWLARGPRLPRLLEAPKPRLRALQRKVLDEVLARVPAHDAAHGFVRGRSVLTHAALHAGQPLVVRFDLAHFFSSVTVPLAHGLFRALGYPREVAATLLALCTTRTPEFVLRRAPFPEPLTARASGERFHHQRLLAERHLPQGAPTSPALANLVAYGLDVRLAGYARARDLRYSRYADDLVFSGAPRSVGPLCDFVRQVVREQGFRLNEAKTRVMRAQHRQHVTGLVVNAKPAVPREAYDLLKARLHRCRRDGPRSLTPDVAALAAELRGQIAWVTQSSPARGVKLRAVFDAIDWPIN
ncbi:MAG: reverse transcriptase family protein [Myxococcota bacterium]